MMRLLCDGVVLDLPRSQKITFTKQNPLFAFDNMSCERTAEFSLPATPTNDRVLSLARIPSYSGEGMRRKFAAQLQHGTIVKDGYLYVSKFSGGSYKAIFVCGELVKLQALKDAGNLDEVLTDTTSIYWGGGGASANNNTETYRAILYSYTYELDAYYVPSIKMSYLLDKIATRFGISISYPSTMQYVRVLPPSPHSIIETDFAYRSTTASGSPINDVTLSGAFAAVGTTRNATVGFISSSNQYEKVVKQYRTNNNIDITFPNEFGEKFFIVSFDSMTDTYGTFLGDYSFQKILNADNTTTTTTSGDQLSGRTISIPKNTSFLIVSMDDYENSVDSGGSRFQGWQLNRSGVVSYQFALKIKGTEEAIGKGEYLRLQDNLPQCTAVDLLKTVAALDGKVLNFDGSVKFDNLDFNSWDIVDIAGKVVSCSEMTRTFGDYGQNNEVAFDSEDYVSEAQRLKVNYSVENDNIEENNELQTIPFCECGVTLKNGKESVQVLNYDEPFGFGWSLIRATTDGNNWAERVMLPKNANLQRLCDSSTTIRLSAHMSLLQAEQITPKTRILLNGTLYVWFESKWSDGTIELKLSKI